jgi:hypothetical protein
MEAGVHVAAVNMSTNLRIKKRGNVPPRLLTLEERDVSMWIKMKAENKTYVARRVM